MDLSIVIPCYNEVNNVPKLQREFFPVATELAQTRSLEVVFVDDGSRDGTWQAISDAFGAGNDFGVSIKIKRHYVNQGLGAAIRTGFAAATGDIVVTTDCDGTYRFTEIPNLLSYLTPDVDMVTASPYHPDGNVVDVPAYRLILSKGSSAIYRLLVGWRVHTYTALFRAYRREVTQKVPFESNGFLAGTEILVNGMRMGYTIAEYPTRLHSRVHGESKAKLARTVQAHLGFQMSALMPWHPFGTLIKGSDDTVYLYTGNQKRQFFAPEIFESHGYHWDQIVQVSDSHLDTIPNGPPMSFRDGTLIRGADPTVYAIEHGQKRPIPSEEIFKALGYQWGNILEVSLETLNSVETGPTLETTDTHPDGTLIRAVDDKVYLLETGKKRYIPSVFVFLSWGYKWEQIVTVSEEELANYELGTPVSPQEGFELDADYGVLHSTVSPKRILTGPFFAKLPRLAHRIVGKARLKIS